MMKLKNESNICIPKGGQRLAFQTGNFLPFYLNTSCICCIQGSKYMQQGTFSGTGRTNDAYNFTLLNVHVDTPKHFQVSIFLTDIRSGKHAAK